MPTFAKTSRMLTPGEAALKWVGAWTQKMRDAGFRFDSQTRRLAEGQAVKFVRTVMNPGFMQDAYVPKVLDYEANARVHAEVEELARGGADLTYSSGQRAFDQLSSFDLRAMVNNYYYYGGLAKDFSETDLRDPLMTLFDGMPGVAVIGAQSFPTFALHPISDLDRIVYRAPGFMEGQIETTRGDRYVKNEAGVNFIAKENGEMREIDQRWSFPRVFAEHGLFGYEAVMENFDPLTALGGMGMSNLVVHAALTAASILTNAGKDKGQLFAEGGYYENTWLNGLTGFQEMIQSHFHGSGILIYAHDYYGGIGRQLLASGHAKQVENEMKLILFHRVSGDKRLPVNETWTDQAADPLFHAVYSAMKDVAWEKEVGPLLEASAEGKPIDTAKMAKGFREHARLRYLACEQYFGNPQERAYIMEQAKLGNAVFPLGEGSNNSTKLYIGGPQHDPAAFAATFPVLNREDALKALTVKGTITTGQVPFKMLVSNVELGSGFAQIHDGNALPAELISII